MTSAAAAPRPENSPENLPNWRVLRMQRMPIGPTGAAIENPKIMPFKRKPTSEVMLIPCILADRSDQLKQSPLERSLQRFLMNLSGGDFQRSCRLN